MSAVAPRRAVRGAQHAPAVTRFSHERSFGEIFVGLSPTIPLSMTYLPFRPLGLRARHIGSRYGSLTCRFAGDGAPPDDSGGSNWVRTDASRLSGSGAGSGSPVGMGRSSGPHARHAGLRGCSRA